MTEFLTDYGVVFALGCAGAAVLYGALITQRLLAKSPGNEQMQEISGAVQEGASAYLKRQYTIIAGVARGAGDPADPAPGRRGRRSAS